LTLEALDRCILKMRRLQKICTCKNLASLVRIIKSQAEGPAYTAAEVGAVNSGTGACVMDVDGSTSRRNWPIDFMSDALRTLSSIICFLNFNHLSCECFAAVNFDTLFSYSGISRWVGRHGLGRFYGVTLFKVLGRYEIHFSYHLF
jgi:hypothetical protein